MLIKEVCKECSLTKKAVEYYIEQGLICPAMLENGYRSFSEEDAARLKKISVLRNLELSVADIREVLSKENAAAFHEIAGRKGLEIASLQEKQKLIQELALNHDWEQVSAQLRQIEKKQSILERLLHVFPGAYGRYICLHFAAYLNEPIESEEQQEAFHAIIDFLDNISFEMPDDLQGYLDEITAQWDEGFMENMSAHMNNAVKDIETFLAENRDIIETVTVYKQTDEYQASIACRLEKTLRQLNDTSGYNDVFLPAMRRLSKSYQEYYEALQKADEVFRREK